MAACEVHDMDNVAHATTGRSAWKCTAARESDVMFVHFGPCDRRKARRVGAVPCEREELAFQARAQAVRAFTAHADMGRGFGDAARVREELKEE